MWFALPYVASHSASHASVLLWAALHPPQTLHLSKYVQIWTGDIAIPFPVPTSSLEPRNLRLSQVARDSIQTGMCSERPRNHYVEFWLPKIQNRHTRYHLLSSYDVPSLCEVLYIYYLVFFS